MESAAPVVGRKRRRSDQASGDGDLEEGNMAPSLLTAQGIGSLWRAYVSSPAEGVLRRVWRAVRDSRLFKRQCKQDEFTKTERHEVLILVFERLDIRDLFRCSITCKTFQAAIASDEFRSAYRRLSRPPFLALFTHRYYSLIPVARAPQQQFQNVLLSLDFKQSFIFIADSRDGHLLLVNCFPVLYQRFLICNPVARLTWEIPEPPYNPDLVYLTAGFIPRTGPRGFEVIVLYAHAASSHTLVSSSYLSAENTWITATHNLDHSVKSPSEDDIRVPSVLIEKTLSILVRSSFVLRVLLEEDNVQISHILLPATHIGKRQVLSSNLIGKIGKSLCFLGATDGGFQVWMLNESSNFFSDPRLCVTGANAVPRLLGFAEENSVVIVQPRFLAPENLLLIHLDTEEREVVTRKGDNLYIVGYEMEWPPFSKLRRHTAMCEVRWSGRLSPS